MDRETRVIRQHFYRSQDSLDNAKSEIEELKDKLLRSEDRALHLSMHNTKLSEMIDELRSEINDREEIIEKKDEYIDILKSSIKRLSQEEDEFEKIIAGLMEKKVDVLEKSVEDLNHEFEE